MSAPLIPVQSGPPVCLPSTPDLLPRLRLLRLSLTDLCNFRCRYCMPTEGVLKTSHSELLSLEELASLAAWLSQHTGIDKVRLTGGEPLIRPGIEHLIAKLATTSGTREVALTTNGSLLPQMAGRLKAAGLARVNISLDSLDEERFTKVTRGGSLKHTLAGIEAAQKAGLAPIKLNTVLLRSTWRQEVPRLLDYAASTGFEIRFIELMRTGTEQAWCEAEFISVDEVCSNLRTELSISPAVEQSWAPSRRTEVDWRGTHLTVGWITPRSHPFCNRCERLRMDARGRIRRCLMDPETLDLARLLRRTDSSEAQKEFNYYIRGKVAPRAMDSPFAMNQVGG